MTWTKMTTNLITRKDELAGKIKSAGSENTHLADVGCFLRDIIIPELIKLKDDIFTEHRRQRDAK